MLLTRKASGQAVVRAAHPDSPADSPACSANTMDRRSFLKRSGVTLGAGASRPSCLSA